MDRLRELDKVAFVRFASVYRDFKDVDQFMATLKGLLETGSSSSGSSTRPRDLPSERSDLEPSKSSWIPGRQGKPE